MEDQDTSSFLLYRARDPIEGTLLKAMLKENRIERVYLMYYELFGQPMRLHPFDEIPGSAYFRLRPSAAKRTAAGPALLVGSCRSVPSTGCP